MLMGFQFEIDLRKKKNIDDISRKHKLIPHSKIKSKHMLQYDPLEDSAQENAKKGRCARPTKEVMKS